MNQLAGTLYLLLGILLIVGGVVAAFLTGFDPVYGSGGAILIAGGAVLLWKNRASAEAEPVRAQPERSRQKPLNESARSRFDKKI
ncbi:MAG TPA: hypothetical protein VEK08_14605 [Planctomycetota bacterium]|nr:hypothetical protein [Planctomycetota bacterium]